MFELPGDDLAVGVVPHIFHQTCIGVGELTSMAQRVVRVDLALESVIQEEFGEVFRIADALQDGVHEAGVTQVLQTHCSSNFGGSFDVLLTGSIEIIV